MPHGSYLNRQKAKEVAKKDGELSNEELGFLAVWKVTVLTPIALELLEKRAPDLLMTLNLLL